MEKIQKPRGTQDVLPSEQKYWDFVVKTFEKIYKDKTDGKNYKFLTVCLQFHGLTEEEENALASFILNEARGIMLAKKFLSK